MIRSRQPMWRDDMTIAELTKVYRALRRSELGEGPAPRRKPTLLAALAAVFAARQDEAIAGAVDIYRDNAGAMPAPTVIPSRLGVVHGWSFNRYLPIDPPKYGWSDTTAHGDGEYDSRQRRGSQGARSLYATRRDALHAARMQVILDFAADMMAIDAMLDGAEE